MKFIIIAAPFINQNTQWNNHTFIIQTMQIKIKIMRLVTSKIHITFSFSLPTFTVYNIDFSNRFNEMANKLNLLHMGTNAQLKFYSAFKFQK